MTENIVSMNFILRKRLRNKNEKRIIDDEYDQFLRLQRLQVLSSFFNILSQCDCCIYIWRNKPGLDKYLTFLLFLGFPEPYQAKKRNPGVKLRNAATLDSDLVLLHFWRLLSFRSRICYSSGGHEWPKGEVIVSAMYLRQYWNRKTWLPCYRRRRSGLSNIF